MPKHYDIIIVGGGPAGLTAAIYARRAEKSVLILEKNGFGGQIAQSPRVDNFPGIPSVSGAELSDKMLGHALELGAEIDLAEVTGVEPCGGGFTVRTPDGEGVVLEANPDSGMLKVRAEGSSLAPKWYKRSECTYLRGGKRAPKVADPKE